MGKGTYHVKYCPYSDKELEWEMLSKMARDKDMKDRHTWSRFLEV